MMARCANKKAINTSTDLAPSIVIGLAKLRQNRVQRKQSRMCDKVASYKEETNGDNFLLYLDLISKFKRGAKQFIL